MTKITAQVEIKDLGKTIEMEMKAPDDLEDCQNDTIVVLVFDNGNEYTGKFGGMDDDTIILHPIKGIAGIGLPMRRLASYFEEIKSATP